MLFKNITEIKEHTECGAVTFASLSKSIRLAEAAYIKPVLGAALYDALNTAYQAAPGTPLADRFVSLLYNVQETLAPFAMYIYIPKAEVMVTDSGAMRTETATNKSAFQYQITNQRNTLLTEAMAMQEQLLQFLETNKSDYSEWTDSDEFKKYRSLFIKTAEQFNTIYSTASPYRNYYFMRSIMFDCEQQIIRKAIGDPLFTDLKTKDAAPDQNFSDEEKILIQKLNSAITHFTIAKAIPRLSMRLDDQGITVMSAGTSSNDDNSKRNNAPDNQLSLLMRTENDDGDAWLSDALEYISTNASESVFIPWYNQQQDSDDDPTTDASAEESINASFTSVFTL